MSDQAHHLRQLVRDSVLADAAGVPGGAVVVISGAAQGVGATTVACGIAAELARLGQQVVLVDAHLERSALADRLAAQPRGTLADVLNGTRRAVEIIAPTEDAHIRLLAGATAAVPTTAAPSVGREGLDRLAAELAALARQADFILLDAGCGMSAWVDGLWQLARQALLVTAPLAQSLLDAYAAVKLAQHHRHDGRVRLVINGASDESEAAPLARRFEETCGRFLCIQPKPAAHLPPPDRAAAPAARPPQHTPRQRALRLLAADLISDYRTTNLRIPRPKPRDQRNSVPPTNPRNLSRRR